MKTISMITASMAVLSAMANTLPSQMGVEVVRSDDGNVLVREVVCHNSQVFAKHIHLAECIS